MKNIFRFLLLSAVALTVGFAVSCTPQSEPDHYQGTPTIVVAPASVTVPLAGGTTEAVTITTPAEWTIDIDTEGVTASMVAGMGDATVTFDVPAADAMRTINIVFTATGYVSGFPITKKATLAISQTDSVMGFTIYSDNCGSAVSKVDGYWPYVDKYEGWAPTGGDGIDQSGVTYTGKNASVRNSGKTWAPVGATYATDAPYAYLQAKTDTEFVINNINLKSGVKDYTFSFTAFNQYASLIASPFTPVVTPLVSGENLTVSVSVDGSNWGAVAFTTMADGNWTYAMAPFTLPADASKLYVKFNNYKADTTTPLPDATYQYQAALRFDDFCLTEGGDGPVVDFNTSSGGNNSGGVQPDPTPTPDPSTSTFTLIDSVSALTAGNYIMSANLAEYVSGTTNLNWGDYKYHCWTGEADGKDCNTANYAFADGKLTIDPSCTTGKAAVITLESAGKDNTYYIKSNGKYLYSTAAATNRKLALGADKAEWVAEANTNGGITLVSNGVYLGTASAQSKMIRSYKDAATLKYGVVFFKAN